MFLIVTYDIPNQKRRRKVAELMESYGTRVQRSVFECTLDGKTLAELISDIKKLIKRREDKVQIYGLCEGCRLRASICGQGEATVVPDVLIY
jgi:CRISPR-associated protein Cas2